MAESVEYATRASNAKSVVSFQRSGNRISDPEEDPCASLYSRSQQDNIIKTPSPSSSSSIKQEVVATEHQEQSVLERSLLLSIIYPPPPSPIPQQDPCCISYNLEDTEGVRAEDENGTKQEQDQKSQEPNKKTEKHERGSLHRRNSGASGGGSDKANRASSNDSSQGKSRDAHVDGVEKAKLDNHSRRQQRRRSERGNNTGVDRMVPPPPPRKHTISQNKGYRRVSDENGCIRSFDPLPFENFRAGKTKPNLVTTGDNNLKSTTIVGGTRMVPPPPLRRRMSEGNPIRNYTCTSFKSNEKPQPPKAQSIDTPGDTMVPTRIPCDVSVRGETKETNRCPPQRHRSSAGSIMSGNRNPPRHHRRAGSLTGSFTSSAGGFKATPTPPPLPGPSPSQRMPIARNDRATLSSGVRGNAAARRPSDETVGVNIGLKATAKTGTYPPPPRLRRESSSQGTSIARNNSMSTAGSVGNATYRLSDKIASPIGSCRGSMESSPAQKKATRKICRDRGILHSSLVPPFGGESDESSNSRQSSISHKRSQPLQRSSSLWKAGSFQTSLHMKNKPNPPPPLVGNALMCVERYHNETTETMDRPENSRQQNWQQQQEQQQLPLPQAIQFPCIDAKGRSGTYSGEVNESLVPHGKGTMEYENGIVKDGEWKHGLYHNNTSACRQRQKCD